MNIDFNFGSDAYWSHDRFGKIETLESFGKALSEASKLRRPDFSTATKDWSEAYQGNLSVIKSLSAALKKKDNVLVVGAGSEDNFKAINEMTLGWLKTGVQYTNFNPELQMDVITSTHVSLLEAALHASKPPLFLIHGVYSKVPPCLKRSMTIRWSDPYIESDMGLFPSAKGRITASTFEGIIAKKARGVAPFLPAVRNTLFLNAIVMIWLGARKIVFTGVDPHHPEYFFSNNSELKMEIIRCIAACDPWLAEWDGRNDRLPLLNRPTVHRVQDFINKILGKSKVGEEDYIFEFDRGFALLKEIATGRGVQLGYLGKSSYMKTTGIERIG